MKAMIRMWCIGARIAAMVWVIGLLWGFASWGYAFTAGWLPPAVHLTLGLVVSVAVVPILLYAGISEILRSRS